LKSQWLVTLCISHLVQAARMEQWENQTSRLRNLACYSCIKHRNCQLDSHSLYTHPNSIHLSLFLGSIVVIKKSSASHRKEFCAKIGPKLMRKIYHIQIVKFRERFSNSTKYSLILNFFTFLFDRQPSLANSSFGWSPMRLHHQFGKEKP
jgi:hypothetical protein